MKVSFITAYLFLFTGIKSSAQISEIAITSSEVRDYIKEKQGNRWYVEDKDITRVVFAYDSTLGHYKAHYYTRTHFHFEIKKDTPEFKRLKSKGIPYRRIIDTSEMSEFIAVLFREDTTSIRHCKELHTSHHYMNYFIRVIKNSDTLYFHKTKPFDSTTCWVSKRIITADPAIDLKLYGWVPDKFVGREYLNLARKIKLH